MLFLQWVGKTFISEKESNFYVKIRKGLLGDVM